MDLSSRTVAAYALAPNRTLKAVVPAAKNKDRHLVATTLYEAAAAFLDEVGATHVFIEEPVLAGARNIRSTLLIAQIAGAMLIAAGSERTTRFVPVSTWKAALGHGHADKDAVRRLIDSLHPEVAQECGLDQDLYDAAGVALYGQGLLKRVHQLRDDVQDDPRVPGLAQAG